MREDGFLFCGNFKIIKTLFVVISLVSSNVYAAETDVTGKSSSAEPTQHASNQSSEDVPISNSQAVMGVEKQMDLLKDAYISIYNYTQDPIAFNMGLSSIAKPWGHTHVGLTSIYSANIFIQDKTRTRFVDSIEAWGQTERACGFALGGAFIGAATAVQDKDSSGVFTKKLLLVPSQAYVDYVYKNLVEITAGNILLTTPWVQSISNYPAATYANQNNTYQGIIANFQVTPEVFLTFYRAFTYLQYPNAWFNTKNLYNTYGGPLSNIGNRGTSGTGGVGMWWDINKDSDLELWYYRFLDFADMVYFDYENNIKLPCKNSIDLGLQGLTQYPSGSSLTASTLLPGSTTQFLGNVHGNAVGIKLGWNVPHNTVSVGYNSVFGTSNSYLKGGIVSPYTFGLETDPLYTTPALSSLTEFGSGYAYIIRDSMGFCDDNLKANLSFSQFFVKKVYSTQPNKVTEYDAALQYTMPHTNFSIWTRLVYLQIPRYVGKNLLQPRLIFNYTF